MGPKQTGLREVMYEMPDGPRPVGFIQFDTGHVVVTTYTLEKSLGIATTGHDIRGSRYVFCNRGFQFRWCNQRVIGLDGVEACLRRRAGQIGWQEVTRILAWFRSHGLSETLWPAETDIDKAADIGRRYYRPEAKDGSKLAASLAVLDFSEPAPPEPAMPAKLAEPAVFPYWVCV